MINFRNFSNEELLRYARAAPWITQPLAAEILARLDRAQENPDERGARQGPLSSFDHRSTRR